MVKVIGLDGKIANFYGEQCGRFCVKSDGYGIPFKIIEFGDYGYQSLLIPVLNEQEANKLKICGDLDITNRSVYVKRYETYYNKGFQEIVDRWYLVGETDITSDKVLEYAQNHMPSHSKQKYSRVRIKKENDRCFELTFYPQMTEYDMRKQLKEMGFILKRHKNSCGVNGYMIIKADDNSIYVGENFTMNEADVDKFIHKED